MIIGMSPKEWETEREVYRSLTPAQARELVAQRNAEARARAGAKATARPKPATSLKPAAARPKAKTPPLNTGLGHPSRTARGGGAGTGDNIPTERTPEQQRIIDDELARLSALAKSRGGAPTAAERNPPKVVDIRSIYAERNAACSGWVDPGHEGGSR